MSARRLARLARLAVAALATILSAPPLLAAPMAPDLEVSAPALSFSRRSVTIDITQRGTLAGRRLTVLVFVDRNLIGSYPTAGDRTRMEIDGLELAPGPHDILIKSGTFEARDRFRSVPPAAAAAAAAAAVAAALIALRRRRTS